jgi:hypothetical protein
MESTGEPNRIQVSSSTADLLKEAGKTYWVKAREDLVHAKGKGNVQTFWVVSKSGPAVEAFRSNEAPELGRGNLGGPPGRTRSMLGSEPVRGVKRTTSDSVAKIAGSTEMLKLMSKQSTEASEQREERLVQWQLEMFTRLLKKIIAARIERNKHKVEIDFSQPLDDDDEREFIPLNDSSDAGSVGSVEDEGVEQNPQEPAKRRGSDSSFKFRVPKREKSFTTPVAHTEDQDDDQNPQKAEKKRRGSDSSFRFRIPKRDKSFTTPKKDSSFALPKREASFKIPTRRASLKMVSQHSHSTLYSIDAGISVLGDSVASFNTQSVSMHPVSSSGFSIDRDEDKIVVDEVAEVIALPQFTPEATKVLSVNADDVQLSDTVVEQLKDYIATIAHMYRKNPFHNFEVSFIVAFRI